MSVGVVPPSPARGPVPGADEPIAFLSRQLESHRAHEGLLVITIPVPAVPIDVARRCLVRVAGKGAVGECLWDAQDGPSFVGVGCAASVEGWGADRLEEVRAGAELVLGSLRHAHCGPGGAPAPRLFGGMAFHPGDSANGPWRGFADASFALPRLVYGVEGRRAWLSLAVRPAQRSRPQLASEVADVVAVLTGILAHDARPGMGVTRGHGAEVQSESSDRWFERVGRARDAIGEGRLHKVVLARWAEVAHAGSLADVLEILGARYPQCTRFAFGRGDATFVGATPERLVKKHASCVETEALAGTVAHGDGARLLRSAKDRAEHEFVIDAIRRQLGPLCRHIEVGTEPVAHELPNVVHLRTPVAGTLREGVHVIDLVGALHPTPAVGGVPTEDAVRWIREAETMPRGWYSGPVGWFDAAGDGEFVVALRSGLVRGNKAWLWAGAGIVAGSEPQAELDETNLKLRPLLEAVGAAP